MTKRDWHSPCPFIADLFRREAHLQRAQVALTSKEFALRSLLVYNTGRVVTQPQLLQEV